ncbi:MAG: recombinase A [Myxococcales bacterium]|nr:recombinase A [Myxococcales bacterium]
MGFAETPTLGLALGIEELDACLPDRGLGRGAVVELSVSGALAGATRIALSACRAAQAEGRERGGDTAWCAFVDPSCSLFAPGVVEAGVQLDRLLVVRPPREALSRVSLRIVESRAFALVIIDTMGAPGRPLDVPLGTWPRIVRRLSMAVEGTTSSVVLITDAGAARPLPLPVAQRIELSRPSEHELQVRVAKDKLGRISSPHTLAWGRAGPRPLVKGEPEAGPRVRAANDA